MSTVDLGPLVHERAKLEANLAQKIGFLEAEQKKTKELQAQVRELSELADRVDAAEETAKRAKANAGKWRHERDKLQAALTLESNKLAASERQLKEWAARAEQSSQLADARGSELEELQAKYDTLAKLEEGEVREIERLRELERAVIAYRVALKGLVGGNN